MIIGANTIFSIISVNYRLMFCIILLTFIERFQKSLKPFKLKRNNEIEIKAIVAGSTLLFCGLLFEESSENDFPLLNTVAFIIIIFYNSHFVLEWTYLFILSFNFKNKKIKTALKMYRQITCKKKLNLYEIDVDENDPANVQR